ncbi:hypothetical protein ACWEV4_23935 [Streptomyces sp. NPDC003860]
MGADKGAEKEAPVRTKAEQVELEKRVTDASDQILGVIDLKEKGKTKETWPYRLGCSGYAKESKVERLQHGWSVWGAPDADLTEAFNRLRKELPNKGWKIVKDGTDDTQARAPEIVANSTDGLVSARLGLWLVRPGGRYESAVEVSFATKCFRTAEGEGAG